MEKEKILECYPFKLLTPPIKLVEGFKVYDGVIGDKPGESHKGIDYVWECGKNFCSFEIYAAHGGQAIQSISRSWGVFVIIRKLFFGGMFYTVYSHFETVCEKIPGMPPVTDKDEIGGEFIGIYLPAGHFLGNAGATGFTNKIVQFHFELHLKKNGEERKKLDPYGIYDCASSGRYPQPGESLAGLEHFWLSDDPPFAI